MYRVLPAIPLVLVVVFVIASSQASGREGSKFREAVRSDRGVVAAAHTSPRVKYGMRREGHRSV